MKITAIGLGKPFSNYPKSYGCRNKAILSAPQSKGADIFCFKGSKKLSDRIGIVGSTSQTDLEKKIEKQLAVNPIDTVVKKFKNGETYVNIKGNLRGKDVFIMPATGGNVNDNLMETYLKADAAKRAGANRVVAVMPNFDYARQEKRMEQGEPIAARLNMNLLKASGVDEVITEDLHTPAIEGFADSSIRITHLESMPVMQQYIRDKQLDNLVIVSPDIGGTKRADKLAKSLGCEKAIIYKHRQAHNEAAAEDLVGNVNGKNCIIYDDIIDTACTIAEAAKLLKKEGANDIYIMATHGLFNGEAMTKLNEAPVKEVIVTNSVPPKSNEIAKIKHIDISEQISGAMKEISTDK